MKKWMIGSMVLIAFMFVAAGVFAQTTDKEKKETKKECTFVDKNNDGKCDVCGSTADKCKKDCASVPAKDCAKCPASASCSKSKDEVVPAKEGQAATTPPCCASKKK